MYFNLYHVSNFTQNCPIFMQNWMYQIWMKQSYINFSSNWTNTILNFQIVLLQFELKQIQICYIWIRYIQFCVKLDTWYKLKYIDLYVLRAPRKNLSLKKNNPFLSPGTREYVDSVLRRKIWSPVKPTYAKNT